MKLRAQVVEYTLYPRINETRCGVFTHGPVASPAAAAAPATSASAFRRRGLLSALLPQQLQAGRGEQQEPEEVAEEEEQPRGRGDLGKKGFRQVRWTPCPLVAGERHCRPTRTRSHPPSRRLTLPRRWPPNRNVWG